MDYSYECVADTVCKLAITIYFDGMKIWGYVGPIN